MPYNNPTPACNGDNETPHGRQPVGCSRGVSESGHEAARPSSLEAPRASRNKPTNTNERPLRFDTSHQRRLHRGNHTRRRHVCAAFAQAAAEHETTGRSDDAIQSRKWLEAVQRCGRAPTLLMDGTTGKMHVTRNYCRNRACPTCQRVRTKEMLGRVREIVKQADDVRFLTLTVKSAPHEELREQIDRLIQCFRRFRRRADWKKHVTGGLFVLEVTWSRGAWHPHLHCLIDGRYWHQKKISAAWAEVTFGSRIVDIRRVASREAAARYVAKYVSKGALSDSVPPAKLDEWMRAFKGVRTLATFGHLHGANSRAAAQEREARAQREWQQVCALGAIDHACEFGDRISLWLAEKITRHFNKPPPDAAACLRRGKRLAALTTKHQKRLMDGWTDKPRQVRKQISAPLHLWGLDSSEYIWR